jgi:hypothetical protein
MPIIHFALDCTSRLTDQNRFNWKWVQVSSAQILRTIMVDFATHADSTSRVAGCGLVWCTCAVWEAENLVATPRNPKPPWVASSLRARTVSWRWYVAQYAAPSVVLECWLSHLCFVDVSQGCSDDWLAADRWDSLRVVLTEWWFCGTC